MNKIVKSLAAVLAVAMVFSMMTFAFAAVGARFSMNLVEETDSQVVIAVKLESGSFTTLDFGIEANPAKVAKCSKIDINVDIALAGGVQASNPETGLYGCAIYPAFETEGAVITTYTFEKVAGAEITKDDFAMEVSNCSTDFEVVNNIPVAVAPTEESTEESTEATTEDTTEAPTEAPTEESTEASTEESTEAPTEESTEASTEQISRKVTFSLNLVSESSSEVVLTVKLDSGSFSAVDFGVTYNASKVKKCSKIVGNTDIALEGVQQYYAPTGLYSAGIEPAYSVANSVIATYTFEKVSGKWITKDDFVLKVSNCDAADGTEASFSIRNNLPSVPANQTTTEPSTEVPTEPTTEIHRHSYICVEIARPACVSDGYLLYNCSCGDTYYIELPSRGHSYDSVEVVYPTCTEEGYKIYTCSCGDCYISDYTPAYGHIPGSWVVTKPTTSTSSGVKSQYCLDCGELLATQKIPAKGKVSGVSIEENLVLKYKGSATLKPQIEVASGVMYNITYSSSNPGVATVDNNGNVTAISRGDATITCTVTDQFGNVVTDTCEVNVIYNLWQWIIVIVLFGWIWY